MHELGVRSLLLRVRPALVGGFAGVMLLAAGCQPLSSSNSTSPIATVLSPAAPFGLTLIHSNDTWGYLTPCG
jgi:hypothetical protein